MGNESTSSEDDTPGGESAALRMRFGFDSLCRHSARGERGSVRWDSGVPGVSRPAGQFQENLLENPDACCVPQA